MSRRKERIIDEAALWFVRAREPDFSAADREELAFWLAGSAENVREYLSVAAVAGEIREASAALDIDALVQVARDTDDGVNVVSLPEPGSNPGGPGHDGVAAAPLRRPGLWSIAAGLLVAVAITVLVVTESAPVTYSTGIGEQVSMPLQDGSVVTLNAQSSLEIDFSEDARSVRLVRGEVLFNVAEDSTRPFEVVTERALVRAIGTQFNVRSRGANTTVTVVEGIVGVRSLERDPIPPDDAVESPDIEGTGADSAPVKQIRLTVGEQATVATGTVAVVETDISKAMSWRQRRLVFDAWSLAAVVDEFNLYNDQPIVIDSEELAALPISGAFSADDRRSFALFLNEAGLATAVTRADGIIVLQSRKKDG